MKVNYNKYNSPLFKKLNGCEDVTVDIRERHEWHKLIANNNEIRDFAILKLLFQLTTNQKEIIEIQNKNNHNLMSSFAEVLKLLKSMNSEQTNVGTYFTAVMTLLNSMKSEQTNLRHRAN